MATIEDSAFEFNNLREITIPPSVIEIGESFRNNEFTRVVIPNTVKRLSKDAFKDNFWTTVTRK